MNRLPAILVSCVLALGGCAMASRQNVIPHHYTLGGSQAAAAQAPSATGGATLRIARIEMPAWQQGNGLYYRLAYRNGEAIAAYADSDWAAPPADMLERRLHNALAGGWGAVVGRDSGARADFTLDLRVDDFSQVFTTPTQSFGVLDATATLVAASGGVVAQRHFHFRVAAPGADAAGGVRALDAASRELAQRLRGWLVAHKPNRS